MYCNYNFYIKYPNKYQISIVSCIYKINCLPNYLATVILITKILIKHIYT